MKKNKMMRAASILMVATLLTTSVISGTFAKYVTSESSNDTARVAKFGVEITANGTMFAKEYAKDNQNVLATVTNSVISSDSDKVLAPGTSGDLAKSTITGTPEVAVDVKREATLTLTGWMSKQSDVDTVESYYCPIKITVGNTLYYGLDYDNANDFIAAVVGAINADSHDYAPKTNLSDISNDTLSVTWEWAFEGLDGTKVNRTDYADTYLGNKAAEGNAPKIELTVTTTVTQID